MAETGRSILSRDIIEDPSIPFPCEDYKTGRGLWEEGASAVYNGTV